MTYKRFLMASVAFILSFVQLFLYGSAIAAQLCEDKNRFVGPCFLVEGKLFVSNGTPSIRIVPKGSKRQLGVVNDGDSEDRTLPTEVAKLATTEVHIHGHFEVCPLTQSKPKQMQMVCLISGKNLIAREIP